jgi:hypothetical protein
MPITKADQNVIETSICTTDTVQTITGSKTFSNLSGNVSSATALATGSTTARTLANRFADVGNVKDWGAVGDGVADDSDFIQNAIYYKTNIYFPPGNYRITKTLTINRSIVSLYCDTPGSANIFLDNSAIPIAIQFYDAGGGPCYNNSIQNITLTNAPTSTYQIGIQCNKNQSFNLTDCEIGGFATSLDIRGSINGFYSNIRLNTFTSTNATPGKATLQLSDNIVTGEIYGFTHLFVNSSFNGGIAIRGNDYASFTNCYITPGSYIGAGVLIQNNGSASFGSYNNSFDTCYFDRVANPTPNLSAIEISDAIPATGFATGVKITDCVANDWDTTIKIRKSFDPSINITGCSLGEARGAAIDAEGAFTNLLITGNLFHNNTYDVANSSVIKLNNIHSAVVTGNIFSYNESKAFVGNRNAIELLGSFNAITITGNTINTFAGANVTDLVNTATIDKFVVTGNSSDNVNNTIVGSIIGNQENSSPVSLDWYEEKSFVPTLSFGGNSTSIAYVSQVGNATRIGNKIFFSLYLAISNKGTSTGNVKISGLPFNQNLGQPANYTINAGGLNAAIGDANLDAIQDGATGIQPKKQSGGGNVSLTDVDFTNSAFITITGTYSA